MLLAPSTCLQPFAPAAGFPIVAPAHTPIAMRLDGSEPRDAAILAACGVSLLGAVAFSIVGHRLSEVLSTKPELQAPPRDTGAGPQRPERGEAAEGRETGQDTSTCALKRRTTRVQMCCVTDTAPDKRVLQQRIQKTLEAQSEMNATLKQALFTR